MARISRTREEILKDVEVINGYVWVTCDHCGGSGDYPSSMIPAGRCNRYCWQNRTPGTYGKIPIPVDAYVSRQQAADRREAKRQREWEERREAREAAAREKAARIASPDERIARAARVFKLAVSEDQDVYSFAADIIARWVARGQLSEAQWAALVKATEEEQRKLDERAAAQPVPAGRRVVEGVITKIAERPGYTPGSIEYKLVVKSEEGWAVWGTQPRALWGVKVGDRVRFTAKLEPSQDDPTFGFYSRPTKAEVVARQ